MPKPLDGRMCHGIGIRRINITVNNESQNEGKFAHLLLANLDLLGENGETLISVTEEIKAETNGKLTNGEIVSRMTGQLPNKINEWQIKYAGE